MRRSPLIIIACISLAYLFVAYQMWDKPPYSFHQWRESDSANFAFNYAQDPYGSLLPKVHERKIGPGYAAAEFPIFYYLTSFALDADNLSYIPLRMMSLLHAIIAIFSMYLLAREWTGDREKGLWASYFFALSPLMLYYGQKIMPEVQYMAWGLLGGYLLLRAEHGRSKRALCYVAGTAAMSLACMIKPFAVVFLFPALWQDGKNVLKLRKFVFCMIPLFFLFAWNSFARKLTEEHTPGVFDLSFDPQKWIAAITDAKFYSRFFLSYFVELYLGFVGVAILLLYVSLRRTEAISKNLQGMWLWLLGCIAVLMVFGAHHILHLHDYYGIILIPPLAMILAYAVTSFAAKAGVWRNVVYVLAGCALVVNIARVYPRISRPSYDYRAIAEDLKVFIPTNQRVVVRDETPVVNLTMLNRFGSSISPHSSVDEMKAVILSGFWLVCLKMKESCEELKNAFGPGYEVAEGHYFVLVKPASRLP